MCQREPLERCFMRLRQGPYLVRSARGIRTARHEISRCLDDPASLPQFLHQDVAKNAALFLVVVILPRAKLVQHPPRNERARRQLRCWVRKILPCYRAMVFEDSDVLEALILFQVLDSLGCQAQKALDLGVARVPQLMVMFGVLDQDLM